MTKEQKRQQLLEKCVNALMKEFSTVQIVCTLQISHGETAIDWEGAGNNFARIESLRQYIQADTQGNQASRIAKEIKNTDDE